MEIHYLADFAEAIPQLATWFRAEWPDEIGVDAEQGFLRCTNTDQIPVGFVAAEDGKPVGTVQLLSTSVSSHTHLKPWIGGLYVDASWRHRGVATRLIDSAVGAAGSIGISTVYIGITAAREFYQNTGWIYLEDGDARGEPVMILSRNT